jgi:threonyl-tRNA synthetase
VRDRIAIRRSDCDRLCARKRQKRCEQIYKKKPNFERKLVIREEALSLFADNRFKQEILCG